MTVHLDTLTTWTNQIIGHLPLVPVPKTAHEHAVAAALRQEVEAILAKGGTPSVPQETP